jgi:acyl-CoA:acyl-CoA alkyltransferase
MNASIVDINIYFPKRIVLNSEVESMITIGGNPITPGIIERMFGIKQRRFADPAEQVSDLATKAAQLLLNRNNCEIDLLIFAAASSDLIEPATANIIQQKLGLTCPCMDIKNACNSMTSAIHTASAFIEAGIYNNILITNGEKLSDVVKYNIEREEDLLKYLPGYSLSDAGAAILIGKDRGHKILFQKFHTIGKYWDLCKVEGGGSIAFRNPEKYFFEGNTKVLKDVFEEIGGPFVDQCLEEFGWHKEAINHVFTHQVASSTAGFVTHEIGVPIEKCLNVFANNGNTAAATIAVSINEAIERDLLKSGDKILVIGMAAGVSISVQLIEW